MIGRNVSGDLQLSWKLKQDQVRLEHELSTQDSYMMLSVNADNPSPSEAELDPRD